MDGLDDLSLVGWIMEMVGLEGLCKEGVIED